MEQKDLRKQLAGWYPEPDQMRMVLHEAGFSTDRVETSGGPEVMWFRALREVGYHGPGARFRLLLRVRDDHAAELPHVPTPPVEADPVLDHWQKHEWERLRVVRLLGYRQSGRIKLTLDQVFVSLHARVGFRPAGERSPLCYGPEQMDYAPVDLGGAVALARDGERRGLAILGDPGAGKTTLLRHLFCRVVAEGSAALGLPAGLCPVLLRFAALQEADLVPRGLRGWIERELAAHPEVARRLAAGNRPLLALLDGLDEVPDEATRERVCRWLDEELDRWPAAFFLVTCRLRAWSRTRLDTGFLRADIRWLNDEQVREFVERWYLAVEEGLGGDADKARERADGLADELVDRKQQGNYDLREMARNPLMLSTLCLVHREGDKLPERRARLYEECVRVLLEKWARETRREGLPVEQARQILQPLAWAMHTRGPDGDGGRRAVQMSRDEVRAAIGAAYSQVQGLPKDLDAFLARAQEDCGLLSGTDIDRYAFLHLSLQEYLAAAHARGERRVAELADRIGDSWWREVILLAMSMDGVFAPFMTTVVERGAVAGNLELLAECFDQTARLHPEPFLALLDPPRRPWWRRWLGDGKPDAAEVAAALALFRGRGVPEIDRVAARWEVAVDPVASADALGFEWVRLPPGKFWMGATTEAGQRNHDPGAYADEQPVHRVRLTQEYWMARDPVTNAQYAAFLSDSGRPAPSSWDAPAFNRPRQPVVGVDWHDARAFCDWLSTRGGAPGGWVVDLPTEAEWEYAARGPAGRRYPWGEAAPTAAHAVFGGFSKLNGPAEVGGRPAGETPEGVRDLAGNVWEWCLDAWRNRYDKPSTQSDNACHIGDNGAPRVVRGGSWANLVPWLLRAAYRLGDHPGRRGPDLGFRVVRVRVREHVPPRPIAP